MFGLSSKLSAIIAAIGTAILVGGFAYDLHSWAMARSEARHEAALQAQKTALVNECNSDKSLTGKADEKLYLDHATIDGLLDERLRDTASPACLPVAYDTGGVATPASKGNVHRADGQNHGVSRAELYKLAADADKVRADLLTCRAFLENTWKAKGQKETAR